MDHDTLRRFAAVVVPPDTACLAAPAIAGQSHGDPDRTRVIVCRPDLASPVRVTATLTPAKGTAPCFRS